MVSVERYPCFCYAGLRHFESKDGRGFLKCRDETCTLFTPEEKYNSLVECYGLKVDKMFKQNNFPLYLVTRKSRVCGCPTPCQIQDVLIFGVKRRMSMTSATSFSGRCMARQKWRKVWRRRRRRRATWNGCRSNALLSRNRRKWWNA